MVDSVALRERLIGEDLDPGAWSNGPGDHYPAHAHAYDKIIVVASGSIRFGLPGELDSFDLHAGDRLELAAGVVHDANAGPSGVACLEAHLPAGSLRNGTIRQADGTW